MAKNLYILTKDDALGVGTVDGVRCVLITLDGSFSDADIRSAAISQCNARAGRAVYPNGYFDASTPLQVSNFGSGPLKNDGDAYVIHGRGVDKVSGPVS
jgi:hypothetical protein